MYNKKESEVFNKEYKALKKRFGTEDETLEQVWHDTTSGRFIGDAVFGANDGIITTFAVVAGVAGAGLSPLVIIVLGVANMLADAASMGLGNYLGKRSEVKYIRMQRKKVAWEIDTMPEQEREEIEKIFKDKGFSGEQLDCMVEAITSKREVWLDTMLKDELGLLPEDDVSPARHGIVTFIAFVIAGVLPLLPFVIPGLSQNGFEWSMVMTGVALFVVGALRTKTDGSNALVSGIEMLLVGGIAAVIAYSVGFGLAQLVGIMA